MMPGGGIDDPLDTADLDAADRCLVGKYSDMWLQNYIHRHPGTGLAEVAQRRETGRRNSVANSVANRSEIENGLAPCGS
jgi:hypothetical protein